MNPRRPRPSPPNDAFVAVPISALPPRTEEELAAQRELYEKALEEARQACEPPSAWLERFSGRN